VTPERIGIGLICLVVLVVLLRWVFDDRSDPDDEA
jgi:hypothetical protein